MRLIESWPNHRGVHAIVRRDHTRPVIVTHLARRYVNHRWQRPVRYALQSFWVHLLQRALRILLGEARNGMECTWCTWYWWANAGFLDMMGIMFIPKWLWNLNRNHRSQISNQCFIVSWFQGSQLSKALDSVGPGWRKSWTGSRGHESHLPQSARDHLELPRNDAYPMRST